MQIQSQEVGDQAKVWIKYPWIKINSAITLSNLLDKFEIIFK
jgi:hypothetical protein